MIIPLAFGRGEKNKSWARGWELDLPKTKIDLDQIKIRLIGLIVKIRTNLAMSSGL